MLGAGCARNPGRPTLRSGADGLRVALGLRRGGGASRKSALACDRPLALIAMGGPERPDVHPISAGRTRPLEACKDVLGQVVRLAAEAGLVQ